MSPGSGASLSASSEGDDLAPPFSAPRPPGRPETVAEPYEERASAPNSVEPDETTADSEEGAMELPDFLDDDEPWAGSHEEVAVDEGGADAAEEDPWADQSEPEDEPWAAREGERVASSSVARPSGPDADSSPAPLEDSIRRAADRLEGLARRLRTVSADEDALSAVGREDPLALLVVGFVMGQRHEP